MASPVLQLWYEDHSSCTPRNGSRWRVSFERCPSSCVDLPFLQWRFPQILSSDDWKPDDLCCSLCCDRHRSVIFFAVYFISLYSVYRLVSIGYTSNGYCHDYVCVGYVFIGSVFPMPSSDLSQGADSVFQRLEENWNRFSDKVQPYQEKSCKNHVCGERNICVCKRSRRLHF